MSIADNLKHIRTQIPANVTLVAVSKTKPNADLLDAYRAGQRDFGENYVQELIQKQAELPGDIHWHFIGHLQSNKVKQIAPFVHLVHGVDSLKLLQEIDKQAAKCQRIISFLLQIYIAKEETKFGLSFDECDALLKSEAYKSLTHVKLEGLMAMASFTANETAITNEFKSLKSYADNLQAKGYNLPVLSFGMSGDYPLAIACGSTLVRVGSAIFGQRQYVK